MVHEDNLQSGIPILGLDGTALVFLPGSASSAHRARSALGSHKVAQVTIEASGDTKSKVETIAMFFLAQREVSSMILRIIRAHQYQRLPTPAKFDTQQYALIADTKPWEYGKTLKLFWGDEKVTPCEDKWTFQFTLKD